MREEEIKRKRTESRLVELIPEALSTMNDNRINGLSVTEVVCSRGRYDAKVYLDKSYLDEKEQGEALAGGSTQTTACCFRLFVNLCSRE